MFLSLFDNALLLHLSFESPKGAFNRFTIENPNCCQCLPPASGTITICFFPSTSSLTGYPLRTSADVLIPTWLFVLPPKWLSRATADSLRDQCVTCCAQLHSTTLAISLSPIPFKGPPRRNCRWPSVRY